MGKGAPPFPEAAGAACTLPFKIFRFYRVPLRSRAGIRTYGI
ncbi:hypothetical protein WCP94_002528 [Bilophila wadsworthia]